MSLTKFLGRKALRISKGSINKAATNLYIKKCLFSNFSHNYGTKALNTKIMTKSTQFSQRFKYGLGYYQKIPLLKQQKLNHSSFIQRTKVGLGYYTIKQQTTKHNSNITLGYWFQNRLPHYTTKVKWSKEAEEATGVEEKFSSDMDKQDLEDYDFDTNVVPKIKAPNTDDDVKRAVEGKDAEVILWRGLTKAELDNIKNKGCSRASHSNASATRPTADQVKKQLKEGGVLTEFQAKDGPVSFSLGNYLAVVQVNTKYLSRGSSSENGWVVHGDAPLKLIDSVDRTAAPTTSTANAS